MPPHPFLWLNKEQSFIKQQYMAFYLLSFLNAPTSVPVCLCVAKKEQRNKKESATKLIVRGTSRCKAMRQRNLRYHVRWSVPWIRYAYAEGNFFFPFADYLVSQSPSPVDQTGPSEHVVVL